MVKITSFGIEENKNKCVCDYCKKEKDIILYFNVEYDDVRDTIHICPECLSIINLSILIS